MFFAFVSLSLSPWKELTRARVHLLLLNFYVKMFGAMCRVVEPIAVVFALLYMRWSQSLWSERLGKLA
jgi:K+-transporting ATPase A subunit